MELNEIEQDIQPEDFSHSLWQRLVKECGPKAVLILAEYRESTGEKIHIPAYEYFVHKANQRANRKRMAMFHKEQRSI